MANHFGTEDINKYRKFKKVDGATYRKVNLFLRKRTYITAREWAIARLCTDFRTRSGAEMTFIGQHLPELVPFMQDVYTPQAVNQARNSFKKKVYKSGATFFYGAMCGFFTTEELDDLLFEASEVARFLLEVERTSLQIDDEIDIEDRITEVMRSVGAAASAILRAREMAAAREGTGEKAGGDDEVVPAGMPDQQGATNQVQETMHTVTPDLQDGAERDDERGHTGAPCLQETTDLVIERVHTATPGLQDGADKDDMTGHVRIPDPQGTADLVELDHHDQEESP